MFSALFSPIDGDDDFIGGMVETAIFAQWIQSGKGDLYYANWTKGRDKGEVDIVWLEETTQKAISMAEVKWTDRFAENMTELKSVFHFLEANSDVKKIVVTSKTRTSQYRLHEGCIQFVPSAIYAYWVSDFLFRKRRHELLYI